MRELTKGFHHITMVTTDARRTVRFYRDVLGIGLVKRTVNYDDPASYHLYFGDERGSPGTLLTFFEWKTARSGRWGVGGVHHLALITGDENGQLKWKRRLVDHGVPVSGPYDRGWFHSIYFRDPDGQILEIATRGPGYALDEPADALGQQIIIPESGRLRGHRDESLIAARTWPEPVDAITAEMRLDGIHHITGITDDIERADVFYREALGLRIVKKSVNQDDGDTPHWFWARYDGAEVEPRSALTLFEWKDSMHRSHPGAGQTHHIAFRASSAEAQREWREHLVSMGVDVTAVMDRTYFTSIYFRAPDGQLLEIATDGPGFAVDEENDRLGTVLQLPAWLEPERERISGSLATLP